MATALIVGSALSAPEAASASENLTGLELEAFRQLNQIREDSGVSPLYWDPMLAYDADNLVEAYAEFGDQATSCGELEVFPDYEPDISEWSVSSWEMNWAVEWLPPADQSESGSDNVRDMIEDIESEGYLLNLKDDTYDNVFVSFHRSECGALFAAFELVRFDSDIDGNSLMADRVSGAQVPKYARNRWTTTVRGFDDYVWPYDAYSDSYQFVNEVAFLANNGIVSGYQNSNGGNDFHPFAEITRDAFAAWLYRAAGSPEFTAPAQSPFSDVSASSSAFYKEITWAQSQGIVNGWDDGTFRPYALTTRDAAAAFFYRAAGSPEFTVPRQSPFSDVSASNSAFYKEITWAQSQGIIQGWADGSFHLWDRIKRDAAAAFTARYVDANYKGEF
ncbi:S-layer homology domain-containing protein [Pseudoclavibacter soli]|uniref:S-layer homology domain-containing protein n=1 Tax=Pseudoclavibacter soli TaxID=452623 RepID=UPI000684D96F|nr:S-layer homology domain-containing protein [Pseudoclavibacter soli]